MTQFTTLTEQTARDLIDLLRRDRARPVGGPARVGNIGQQGQVPVRWGKTSTTPDYPTYPSSGNVVGVSLGNYEPSPLYPGATAVKTFTAYDPPIYVFATLENGSLPAEGTEVRLTWRNGRWWILQDVAAELYIRNDSGAARNRGETLEVTGVVSTPITSTSEVLTGDLRDIEAVRGIILEDIADGATGQFALAGLVYAVIDILDADHTHCYAKTNDANPQSNFGGPWRIVAKPTGTGSAQPALLLLGDPCYERKIKTDATLTAGSSAACSFYIDGVDVGSETVYFNWMENGVASVAINKEGLARWFDDEEKWCLVSAECA
jgi:hypothetical protein